jgi:putative toxin-antitoxin system antitoxin component (TIGR02293 family)
MDHATKMKRADQPDPAESHQFEDVVNRATEVFANQEKALRWLGTPVGALQYSTPISLLGHPDGRQAVLDTLDKIEHGVL